MGQFCSFWPQQVQVIKWPHHRKTQSTTFSMHTLHLCSFSRIVPSSILLLAEILSLNPMPHNAKTRLTCWVVNFIISCSVTGATQSTSKTFCRQIGHSVNFFPHWLQVTRWPQSRMTQSMSSSIHTLHLDPSSSSATYFSSIKEGLLSPCSQSCCNRSSNLSLSAS